jgi:Type ISP C-terminal specificity domain
VKATDLVVSYSYYGSAQGAWRERPPTSKEPWRDCWGEQTGDLYLNDQVFLKNVPNRVWHYELGGYPVMKKWLGYRDAGRRTGRPLSLGEIEQLQGMVRRLAVVLILHEELDQVYERAAVDAFLGDQLRVR